MKASTSKPVDTFTPVTLTLTLETQGELDALGSLFNNGRVTDTLNEIVCKRDPGDPAKPFDLVAVWEMLKHKGAYIGYHGKFSY